jgi:pseudaminic acid synthase
MIIDKFDLAKDGTFIIAELSANHNGDLSKALESIKAAKEFGANAIKIQTYTAETMTLNSRKNDFIVKGGTLWDGKTLYELYELASTPWEWHEEMFSYARQLGITIFSSPFDKSAVDFLEKFDPPAYKIASFEISDYELVRYTASKGKPIIISTGVASIDEIQDVVDICREVGNNDIILLKCTSAYPAALEDANLKTIPNLAETFNVVSGFSDHTMGITAPIVAVTLGAKVIEKHFILDKAIGGPDADFSLDKKEFTELVAKIRDAEKLLGHVDYRMTDKKLKNKQFARSIYISKDIKAGETFNKDNIRIIRPGYSLHPKYFPNILGTKAQKDYELGDRIELWITD